MVTISTQTFLYTYFGDGIETTSNSVSDAVYSSDWYTIPTKLRKDLMIILERVKRRSAVTAGKLFSLNLALFKEVCNNLLIMWIVLIYIFVLDHYFYLSTLHTFERSFILVTVMSRSLTGRAEQLHHYF